MRKFLTIGVKHDGSHVVIATPDVPRLEQRERLREFTAVSEHPDFARVSLGVFQPSKSARLDKPGSAAARAKAAEAEARKLEAAKARPKAATKE